MAVVEPAAAILESPAVVVEQPATVFESPTAILPPAAASSAQVLDSAPPAWLELARQRPVIWMAVAPIVAAILLIIIVALSQPAPIKKAHVEAPPSAASPAPAEPSTRPDVDDSAAQKLAQLEGKPADTLSIDELLLVNAGHAKRKHDDALALSRKLQQAPELANEAPVQAELLRLAADPDTAGAALGAMAQTNSPIGPDLLYQVWTNRFGATATTELARSLLFNRDVLPRASPSLAIALELRSAGSCEAVQAALPEAIKSADGRAVAPLVKLNARRGCGAEKTADCYACLRPQMKPVVAAIAAAKRRRAPVYPEH